MKNSKKFNTTNFVTILFSLLSVCELIYAEDHQSKVTSITVTTTSPSASSQSDRKQTFFLNVFEPRSDVTYSEPDLEEQKKSKIDLIKKDPQFDLYKRPPNQFSEFIKNQQLIDKQKASNGRLNARLFENGDDDNQKNNLKYDQKNYQQRLNNQQLKYELNNQFSEALNYLIKYINRQGQTRLINGTEKTKNSNNILLKHARNLDRDNCLLRLICEISSNQEDASDNQLIKEIRLVFSNKHQAPAYPTKRDPSFPFYYAGHVGSSSNNAERCLDIFPVCSARTDELLKIVDNANKYTNINQAKLNRKSEKMLINSKLERELDSTSESKQFSEKMRNKMKKLHKQYVKKLN